MYALILAAGDGGRLYPLTDGVPKPLLKLHGRPIINHVLDGLMSCGVDDATIVVGYRGDALRAALENRSPRGMTLHFVENPAHELENARSIWAARYAADEPALEQSRPFTSADLDFHGGRDAVLHLARQLNLRAQFPPSAAMTALAGVIPIKVGDVATSIEFVRQIGGLKSPDISELAIERDFQGVRIRVLNPISLLCGKTNLAMTVDQKQRRDADHLRILVICTRAFLRETLAGVETAELPARGWLGAVERVLKLAKSSVGKKAARKLGIIWREALPEIEIEASQHRLVAQFRRLRLPQWLEK